MNIHRSPENFNLSNRSGPILADGTALRDLIDFEKQEVSMRVLHDPEIYALEEQRIFKKSWFLLAHELEIPKAGDYVLRSIGEDPIIVTRDKAGKVNALLNACAHRGMEVCWGDKGNAATFKCPYHGWVFDSTGSLVGAPFEREMYGQGWDKSELGLRRVKVATRHGLVFGSLDDDGPNFEDSMAGLLWYIDRIYEGVDWEMYTHVPRIVVKGNWKAGADQLSGDAYHGPTQHKAYADLGLMPAGRPRPDEDADAAMARLAARGAKVSFPPTGHSITANPTEETGWSFEGGANSHFLMFPASMGADRSMDLPTGRVRSGYLGVIVPQGAGAFEYWRIGLVDRNAPEELKAARRHNVRIFENALGLVDDWGCYPSILRATRGPAGRERVMRYQLGGDHTPDGWPGPGVVHAVPFAMFKEDTQWNFWRGWFNAMTADEA